MSDLSRFVDGMLASYRSEPRLQYVDRHFIPSREASLEILRLCLDLLCPGYYGRQDLTAENLPYHVGETLALLRESLRNQIERCLCYARESLVHEEPDVAACRCRAVGLADRFLERLPELRELLAEDAQAALEGDPAAGSLDEVVLAYPGFLAIAVHRIAHELHLLGVPLMPRIMSEWAHSQSGADIHPGASIGRRFFLDHATGAVVGATSEIGNGVRLYQGVTLGALSLPRDESGRVRRDGKRHPTVQDDVTIYANATVLGGGTVVGKGAVVGGSVFLTRGVPAGHRVTVEPPNLRVLSDRNSPWEPDFDI